MAGTPNPKAYEQILGDMLATYIAKIGVNDLNTGSAVTSFFEAMAQAVYRSSGDILSILRDFSVDRAEGEALKRLAEEERVFPIPARVATGRIAITDSSFEKISTKVYAGTPPPNIGSTVLSVSDASDFTPTGSVYIGRGTPNIEGPIAYNSITNLGGFFQLNLATPTTKYHNNSESVILSQGGLRNIPSGTSVRTTNGGANPNIVFSTTQEVNILDGETQVTNVPVAAQEPGLDGNVPRNAIKNFVSAPFTGAVVTNPSPFTTGRNEETDEEIRIRIKQSRISKGLGTAVAVRTAVVGARANDENAIVTSNEIISTGDKTTLFIDNGSGYEEKTEGVGLEFIVDSALGGEQFFQLSTGGSQTSIAKAFLESQLSSPFDIRPNDRLALLVGGILSEHVFQEGDFRSNGTATAFEIVSSINSNANLSFSARTIENGTKVTLFAKEENNEFIQLTTPSSGRDAGTALDLPINEFETLRLFKNKKPLSRNGRSATLESENQSDWSSTIATGETLIISVDGTSSITYTIVDADFAAEGTHTSVSKNNTLQSWVNVINTKVTGVTASINGNRLVLSSNLGTSSRASLVIDSSSSFVSKGIFTLTKGLVATGREADFSLSRNTGQIRLNAPLQAGDSLTAGSDATEATLESAQILGGNVTLTDTARLWFMVDNPQAANVSSGLLSDSLLSVTKEPGNIIRYRSNLENAFTNIQVGDYVVVWSEELLPVNRVEGRVHSKGTQLVTDDFFEVKLTNTEYGLTAAEGPVVYLEGISFLRTDRPPQKIEITPDTYQISEIANLIEDQLIGAEATTENDEFIIVSTKNKTALGSLLLFAINEAGKNLNFTLGDSGVSSASLIGFSSSNTEDTRLPLFIHSSFTSSQFADPSNSFIGTVDSAIDLDALGVHPDAVLSIQHPFLSAGAYRLDAQAADERALIDSIAGTAIDLDDSKTIRSIRVDDRYFLLSSLDISEEDQITIVLDSDPANKAFPIRLFRRAITNSTMPINSNQFRAYDVDAGPTVEFSQFFGDNYSFKNHKVLMQAKNIIDPNNSANEDAVLFRSVIWGSGGEKYRVGYFYPTVPGQGIAHAIRIGETVDFSIFLKSGAGVANTIDGTTEWDVTITPNTPVAGVDEVTYSWNSVGTNPTMTTLAPNDYVTINSNGEFSVENTGTFRVSSATSTSFTVTRKNGEAVAENNVATLTGTTISLYEDSNTTAQEIVDYVADNLAEFITAEIVEDNGVTGVGNIVRSTHEDNDFANEQDFVRLVDGLNWIETNDLDAVAPSSQFNFKKTLDLSSFDTNTTEAYAFNDGEEVRIVPTSIPQVEKLVSVLAVTGITTLGDVSTASQDRSLQFSTQVLGSSGAVLVSGGTANAAEAQIIGVSQAVNGTNFMRSVITRSAFRGFNGGSLVKVRATNLQRKVTGISFTTNATITPGDPLPTTSTIELGNRDIEDRYFGEPKNAPRLTGRAFQVEKQGALVCITWDGITGSDPLFVKDVEFNNVVGDISVSYNSDSLTTEYTADMGTRVFTEVHPGDAFTISGFTNETNNGSFVVRGVSDDGLTVSVDNNRGVTEVATSIATVDLSINTEIKEGDTVEIGAPFANLNQGRYRVIRRFNNSIYIDNRSAVEERVVVSSNLRNLGFDATTEFDVIVSGNMRIEWNGNGLEPALQNAKMGDLVTLGTSFALDNRGTFMVAESGDNYIELKNANAVAETSIAVSGVGANILEAQIPAMKFSEYEATVAGDSLVISGNVLNAGNAGTYVVTEVLSKNKIVVDQVLSAVSPAQQLNNLFVQVYVEEGVLYDGYKKIHTLVSNPSNVQQKIIIFDSKEQANKINETAGVIIEAQGKLNFSEETITGFDSYKFHTGLLAEANRIVYGDPRDTTTYPGVAAAGAEIFIDPPLVKRIQVSINIRVNTGTPFSRVTEEVRNAIAALINSSPIGQSIAISDVISNVNSIPGVKAVSISSPAFDPSNDVIVVSPAEKPFVLDIVNDIDVSKVE